MKNIFKKLMPKYVKDYLVSNVRPFNNSNPYAQLKKRKVCLSDAFIYRGGEYETVFIMENNAAMLLSQKLKVRHELIFFDESGAIFKTLEVQSEDFYLRVNLSEHLESQIKVCTFIHQLQYEDEAIAKLNAIGNDIVMHCRGYTGYRIKKSEKSIYSYVHGNFGAMYKDVVIKSLARQRVEHSYTPQFSFESGYHYELFFHNPTEDALELKIIEKGHLIKKVQLKKFSFYEHNFSPDKDSCLEWRMKLPIGRAIIFEHKKTGQGSCAFDVFHS